MFQNNHLRLLVSFFVILSLMMLLYIGLNQNPSAIRSPIMHIQTPHFQGLKVGDESPFTDQDLVGKPYFLNVWATWCSSCAVEHQVWMRFSKNHNINVVGVLYNDNFQSAKSWLVKYGNPYTHLVNDPSGQLIINLGAYGTPETLFVDANGIIRKRFIGPITSEWVNETFEEISV